MQTYFVIEGIGAPGRDFRHRTWSVPPFGEVGWVRCVVARELRLGWRPSFRGPEPAPDSEEWLDACREAGRLVLRIEDSGLWGGHADAAIALCDCLNGLASIDAPEWGIATYPVAVSAQQFREGRVLEGIGKAPSRMHHDPHFKLRRPGSSLPDVRSSFLAGLVHALPAVMGDGNGSTSGLFPAVLYYRHSVMPFQLDWEERREIEIMGEAGPKPDTPYLRVQTEAIFLSAWKAIEAALGGEPPRDRERLAERLRKRQLSPDALPRETFEDKMRWLTDEIAALHVVRARLAHGGIPSVRRPQLTFLDIIRAQSVAKLLIVSAVRQLTH
jgi:hypothetical protein